VGEELKKLGCVYDVERILEGFMYGRKDFIHYGWERVVVKS
jgi:hypothetical protein